jgi:formylmethanofuran dehydrogenase subunit E
MPDSGNRGSNPNEVVVFWIVRDSTCAECGEELGKGRFLRLEQQRPLCLACADLDHLVFSSEEMPR